MSTAEPTKPNYYSFTLALALFMLMFFQSTRQFIATIYYENLTGMGFSPTILYLLVFLSPLLMFPMRAINVNIVLLLTGSVIVAHRLYGSLDSEASLYLIFHAFVIVAFSIYLPAFLTTYYSLSAKLRRYTIPVAAITAPVLAVLFDITLNTLGNTLDLTVVGITSRTGNTLVHPIFISLPICAAVVYFLYRNHVIVKKELISSRTVQRSGVPVSTLVPGICMGFLFTNLFLFMGYPGVVVRWTPGSYPVALCCTAVTLVILIVLLQSKTIVEALFKTAVQVVLNLVQLFVVLDVLYFDTGLAQYLLGGALASLLIDLFLFYQAVASKNYSIQFFIRVFTLAIATYLLLFFMTVFSLVWAHVPGGILFKGRLPAIITLISIAYMTASVLYTGRVRAFLKMQAGVAA